MAEVRKLRRDIGLFTFIAAVTVTTLWMVPHFRPAKAPIKFKVKNVVKREEISFPKEWMNLVVKNRVSVRIPPDMKPAELLGDSFFYSEAYINRDMSVLIVYSQLDPRVEDDLRIRRVYSCDTRRSYAGHFTYQESEIEVEGKKAQMGVDRDIPREASTARLCFPSPDDNSFEFEVIAICKDDQALETAKRIFASVRFRDLRGTCQWCQRLRHVNPPSRL